MHPVTFRAITFLFVGFLSLAARAQEVPVPRLYQYNFLYFNPGYAGSEEGRELCGSLGTPNVTYKNPTLSAFGFYQGRVNENIGAGTQVLYHQNNGYYRFHMGFNGNRAVKFGNYGRLAFGLQVGVKHLAVDYDRVEVLTGDSTLPRGKDNDFRGDANAGLWLNDKRFFAGVSMLNLLAPRYEFIGSADFQDKRQLAVTSGYRFGRESHFELTPSFLFTKSLSDTLQSLDINTTVMIGKILIVGATYRGFYEQMIPWIGMAGVQISDHLQIVASFDVPLDTPKEFYKFNAEGVVRIRF